MTRALHSLLIRICPSLSFPRGWVGVGRLGNAVYTLCQQLTVQLSPIDYFQRIMVCYFATELTRLLRSTPLCRLGVLEDPT